MVEKCNPFRYLYVKPQNDMQSLPLFVFYLFLHQYTSIHICVAGWILFCSNIARAQKPQYTKAKIVWNPFGRTKIPIVQLKCVYIELYSGSCLSVVVVVVFVVEMELRLRFYVRLWFSTKRLADSPEKNWNAHISLAFIFVLIQFYFYFPFSELGLGNEIHFYYVFSRSPTFDGVHKDFLTI